MQNRRNNSGGRQLAKPCYYSPQKREVTSTRKYLDSEFFASQIELSVFRLLKTIPSIRVDRQYPLTIKDRTRTYPKMSWRCDFRVHSLYDSEKFLNIEAKGTLHLREFQHTLKYLEYFNPLEYSRLLIVSREPIKIDFHNTSVTPNEMMFILKDQGFIG